MEFHFIALVLEAIFLLRSISMSFRHEHRSSTYSTLLWLVTLTASQALIATQRWHETTNTHAPFIESWHVHLLGGATFVLFIARCSHLYSLLDAAKSNQLEA